MSARMDPAREAVARQSFAAEKDPWRAQWSAQYARRWQHSTAEQGLVPVPATKYRALRGPRSEPQSAAVVRALEMQINGRVLSLAPEIPEPASGEPITATAENMEG